ncbi:MAG: YybH family protein [Planctomycetota bacterium]
MSARPASIAIAVAVALASGCKTRPSTPATSDDATRERAAIAVCRTQEAAWNRGDVEGFLRAGYADSNELTFFSGGEVTRGFEPMLARFRERYASEGREMGHLTFSELHAVPLSGDWICLRGRWHLDFEREADVGGLFTLILRRSEHGWRIVHDHTSVATS